MKDFGRWFLEQSAPVPAPDETELPEGVSERRVGERLFYEAQCRSCERHYDMYCDLADFDPDMSYCGGSPRCLP